jgi:type I restriction enzyme S subunit
MPPRAEQDAIVDYLDRALFDLDELIEKLQLLRDLGKERMVAAISKLTRSEMSESNDLGWQYRKIGHLFRIVGSGTTPKADDESYFGGNTPWVTTGELRENVIYETERNVSDKALSEYSALRIFPKGSLVMALYGATIGRIAFLGIDSTVNQACCVMSDPLNVDSRFIYYALQGSKSRLLASAVGGGQPNIGQEIVRQFRIWLPSLEEQKKIVNELDQISDLANRLKLKLDAAIEILFERRRWLISAAVSGKIDLGGKS